MGAGLSAPAYISPEDRESVLHYDCSIAGIVKYIKEKSPKNVVVMVGAGISVSAGIPDFRSPGTGLYDNLQKYNLDSPEDIFTLSYFLESPEPFYDLSRAMHPSKYRPTPTHYFIRLLMEKGMLRRCYTQNIDTLERAAGISPDLLVEAHGSFGEASCTKCGEPHPASYFEEHIFRSDDGESEDDKISTSKCICSAVGCDGYVKPNIVFFGENLPPRFSSLRARDLEEADLLIVAGTSLSVAPFCDTVHLCAPTAPRLLLNKNIVGVQDDDSWLSNGQGFKFDRFDNYRDVAMLGECDEVVFELCNLLGWRDDLMSLLELNGASLPKTIPNKPENKDMDPVISRQQVKRIVTDVIQGHILDSLDYEDRLKTLSAADTNISVSIPGFFCRLSDKWGTDGNYTVEACIMTRNEDVCNFEFIATCPDLYEGNLDKALRRGVKGVILEVQLGCTWVILTLNAEYFLQDQTCCDIEVWASRKNTGDVPYRYLLRGLSQGTVVP